MFVTEPDGALSEKTHVRIRITNMQGSCVVLNVPLDYSIDKLKVEIANYLGKETNTESDPLKISLYHKLIVADSGKVLNEESTLLEEGVRDEGRRITYSGGPGIQVLSCLPLSRILLCPKQLHSLIAPPSAELISVHVS